jgi:hypothetical protein
MLTHRVMSRRGFLAATGLAGVSSLPASEPAAPASIAITLDLEMSRNFPTWEQTHWDYDKGNLNAETKQYAVEAARRVKNRGGIIHFFVVGRVLEQENVDWLKEIAHAGHPIGNHTYDHVNVLATRPEDLQFRFSRSPWLIERKKPIEVIRENIRLTTAALKTRIGVNDIGFRTPGGFHSGLRERPDIQRLLIDLGFSWISSLYPPHPNTKPGFEPDAAHLTGIRDAQKLAQPFVYSSGLIEVPMSPISDIGAFRTGKWKLDWFLTAIRTSVQWAIERRATFDFLGHPSCLYAVDPDFRTIDLICDLVAESNKRAVLTDLGKIATMAKRATRG